jgi:cell division protein FtsW
VSRSHLPQSAKLDRGICLSVFAFLGIGLVQVYSSSFIFATESRGDGLFFVKRQLIFSVLALLVMFATANIPFRWLQKHGTWVWLAAAAGVAATLVPHIGVRAGGAARWLKLPSGIVFEPSELLKISLSLLLASFFSVAAGDDKKTWLYRSLILAVPLLLVLKQPDFGSFFICTVVGVSVLFAFGLRWRYVIATVAVAMPAFYFLVMNVAYRRARVLAFLDPWADPEQKGFQVIQSMLTVHSGGLTGAGLGQGQGKLFFLPEAHTDFTLAVLGEEMGFIGIAAVLTLYGYLVLRGLQAAVRAEDSYAKVLALGLSLTFALSVLINCGVVMGLLPTKGLTLPFFVWSFTQCRKP